MVIGINCGHTIDGIGCGAAGIIKESEHTRLVGQALMELLKSKGVTVVDCTIDRASTQNEYLSQSVSLANRQDLDLFISIHFNASSSHEGNGVEVYTYEGRQYKDALDVCENISKLGFKNRGVKKGSGLYVIRKTKAKSMLVECCFCDNKNDVDLYNKVGGADAIAKAIFCGIYTKENSLSTDKEETHKLTRDEFHKFMGDIALKDWSNRHIMLPSVVIAQASIESALGTSELARNANALFGIKKNGWTGKVYIKNATEQNPDGSYRTDKDVEWRAYDNWEQSVIDHNDYIATRSTDGGKTLRYKPVIGCENYILACKHLKECGYATSKTYDTTLIDYIEKYNLTKYDEVKEDKFAKDGYLWIVQTGAYKSLMGAEKLQRHLTEMGISSIIKQYKTE